MAGLLVIFICITLVVQYLMWLCFRDVLCLVIYGLTYVVRIFSAKYANIAAGILLFAINLLISLVISLFTGAGNVIGIANLFSSIFISFIMLYDYNKIINLKGERK